MSSGEQPGAATAEHALGLGLAELSAVLPRHAARVERVSRWSVGMHVQHCCLTVIAISGALERSSPPPPRSWRAVLGAFVLWCGRLPRGRARAPDLVRPVGDPTPEALAELLAAAARSIERARALSSQSWFRHFVLGPLARDRALRFIEVHNLHHVRIIRDILAA